VAEVHGKRHDDLLRLIRNRVTDAGEWGLRDFAESSYVNEQGKVQPMFTMTRTGYQFLVGRMTGKKAVEHQIAFIEAFEAMNAHIRAQTEGLQFQFLRKELAYKGRKDKASGAGRELRDWRFFEPGALKEVEALMVANHASSLLG
jgi:Rha family phage regulatory protein